MADLLPEGYRGVQCFYYGDGLPIGFCAQNSENGIMIDALVVPLVAPKAENKPQEPKPSGQDKKDEAKPQPETPEAQEPVAPAAGTSPDVGTPPPEAANGKKSKHKRSKKS